MSAGGRVRLPAPWEFNLCHSRARRRREREIEGWAWGDSFRDLLKPYERHEGAGYLRGRRVAVDLSFWVVSHSTAIRARSPGARKPRSPLRVANRSRAIPGGTV